MRILSALVALALLGPMIQSIAAPRLYVPTPTRRFLWHDLKAAPYAQLLAPIEENSQLKIDEKTIRKALSPREIELLSLFSADISQNRSRSRFSLAEAVALNPGAEAYLLSLRKLRIEELSPEYRNRLERETVQRNVAELEAILKKVNQFDANRRMTRKATEKLLSDVAQGASTKSYSAEDAIIRPDEQRIWSYKSGALVVKGKKGTFEYEQVFSVQGVASAGFVIGTGIALVACAFDATGPNSCPLDSLSFVHGVALPSAATTK